MYYLSINHINQDAGSEEVGKVIGSHVEWTRRQIEAGRIVQAGKWGEAGGMAIIKAPDLAEAENILRQDPLIESGLVSYETAQLYPDLPLE